MILLPIMNSTLKVFLSVTTLLLTQSNSLAQSPELKHWKEQAEYEIQRLTGTTSADPCLQNRMIWQLENAQWFIKNFEKYVKWETEFDSRYVPLMLDANKKWAKTHYEAFYPLPLENQPEIKLTLHQLIENLRTINEQMRSQRLTPHEWKTFYQKAQNPLGVTLDQMSYILEKFNQNLNLSLKQNLVELRLVLTEYGNQFELLLLITDNFGGKTITIDVLKQKNDELEIYSQDKWKTILDEHNEIEDHSTHGMARLFEFEMKHFMQSCGLTLNQYTTITSPFITLMDLEEALVKELSGNSGLKHWEMHAPHLPVNTQSARPALLFVRNSGEVTIAQKHAFYTYSSEINTWEKRHGLPKKTQAVYDVATESFAQYNPFDGPNTAIFKSAEGREKRWYFAPALGEVAGYYARTFYYLSEANEICYVPIQGDNVYPPSSKRTGLTPLQSMSFLENGKIFGILEGELVASDEGGWKKVPGASYHIFGSYLNQVYAVTSTHLYVLTARGDVFEYENRQWRIIAHSPANDRMISIAANMNGKLCGISAQNHVYCVSK